MYPSQQHVFIICYNLPICSTWPNHSTTNVCWLNEWMIILTPWCSKAKNVLPFCKSTTQYSLWVSLRVCPVTPLWYCPFAPLIPSPPPRQNKGRTWPIYLVLLSPSVEASLIIRPTPLISQGLVLETCFPTSVNSSDPGYEQICAQSCKRLLAALIPWTFCKVPHNDKELCFLYSRMRTQTWLLPC